MPHLPSACPRNRPPIMEFAAIHLSRSAIADSSALLSQVAEILRARRRIRRRVEHSSRILAVLCCMRAQMKVYPKPMRSGAVGNVDTEKPHAPLGK